MDILKWRQGYETGISAMDYEHRILIGLINQLYNTLRDKDGYDQLHGILQELSEYGEKHLKNEEELLDRYSYPGLEEQRIHHAKYLQELNAFRMRSESNKVESTQEIYIYLRHWWMEHISVIDKKYGPYLQEKGVI